MNVYRAVGVTFAMEEKAVTRDAASRCCKSNDLISQKSGILLWCLPSVALFVGLGWRDRLAYF
jgi:hypothetical protein